MNKTKKNRKNNKTFRKLKKGGMEKDDDGHYHPSNIEEKKKEISQRKDLLTRSERRRKSKSQRKAEQKLIKDLTRQLKELDINPSHKRTFDDTRGYYMHHHTRKSPKKTELPNDDKNSSNGGKRSNTHGGMEGDFDPKKWFEDVLEDSAGSFYEEAIFNRNFSILTPDKKKAVDEYLNNMELEEHDKLMKDLEDKIKKNNEEIKRIKEFIFRHGISPTFNYK